MSHGYSSQVEHEAPSASTGTTSSQSTSQGTSQPYGNADAAASLQSTPDGAEVQQFCNLYGNWSVYGDDYIGPLPPSTEQDYHIRRSDYEAVMAELDAFHLQCYAKANFHPSTGPGIFDVGFVPEPGQVGVLTISLRVQFDFVAAMNPGDYPGADPADLDWADDAEKQAYAAECLQAINSTWSGAMQFKVGKDFWHQVRARVQVSVVESSDNPHYTITVQKIPPGEWAGSSARAAGESSNHGTAEFDSEDVNPADKGGGNSQRAAVHEFGHMIGLGDEYAGKDTPRHSASFQASGGEEIATGDDDRIMSGGESILAEHYITFLEGIREATGEPAWTYAS